MLDLGQNRLKLFQCWTCLTGTTGWLRLLVAGKERGRGNGKSMDDAIDALETNELGQLLDPCRLHI